MRVPASEPLRLGDATVLIYELLDAHQDTAELADEMADDPVWQAHLDYLRALQCKGRELLAHLHAEEIRQVSSAYILDAVRTPFGRYGGGLSGVRPDDLAAHAVRSLLARSPALEHERIDDILFGDANQAGEDNRNVARMAALLAGLPTSLPGSTINRLCGSSLDASMQASRMIESGDASIVLVGGVESMSRAPWVLLKPERAFPQGHEQLHSSTLGWRMVNPRMPEQWTISLGASAEKLAGIYGISREAQDEFALRSHQRAIAGWDGGFYRDWVVPVPDTELERDETMRADTSLEKLSKLKPAFVEGGTVTAGNSSPLNDGAGALLIADEDGAAAAGREPLARVVARGAAAVDPDVFGIAPVQAANIALAAGRASAGRMSRWSSSTRRSRRSASPTSASGRGSIPTRSTRTAARSRSGHPLGASGVRILGGLAHELTPARRRLWRRRDLHRRRAGPGGGPGGMR